MTQSQKVDSRLTVLMRDYGYRVDGNAIISIGVRGFTVDSVFGSCKDKYDAAVRLCPIIAEPEYTERLNNIGK